MSRRRFVSERLESLENQYSFLPGQGSRRFSDADAKSFHSSLLTTVQRLTAIGSHPWILLEVPIYSFNIPMALFRSTVFQTDLPPFRIRPTVENEFDQIDPKIMAEIKHAGGSFIDPKPRFLKPTGQHYIIQAEGVILYRDGNHLTANGAKLLILPLLRDSLTIENGARLSPELTVEAQP